MTDDPNLSPGRMRFLLVGMARSGTTVAQRLLSELADVQVAPETHFWRHAGAMAKAYRFPLKPRDADEALRWFATLPSAQYLDFDPRAVVARLGETSYAWDVFAALVEQLVDGSGPPSCDILGEKTPDHLRWCEQLMSAVPMLRVIGLVRDPREVFRSHLSVPWGISDPDQFSEKWVSLSRQLRDVQNLFPDRVLAERYEDLVEAPDEFRARAADFLAARHLTKADPAAALFARDEWWKAGALEAIASRPQQWEEQLPQSVVAKIESVCRDEMRSWGYPLRTEASVPTTQATVAVRMHERRAVERITSTHLPINEAWMASAVVRSYSISATAVRAAEERTRLEHERLKREVSTAQREAEEREAQRDSWRKRAEHLNESEKRLRQDLEAEQLRSLKAERRQLIAEGKIRRLKGRRWWRLGEALGSLRRRPLDPRNVGRVLKVLVQRRPLPSLPDLRRVDEGITRIEARRGREPVSDAGLIDEARSLLRDGRCEDALELLDGLPDSVRSTRTAAIVARDCHVRMGNLRLAMREVKRALLDSHHPALQAQARLLEGRIREMDTRWLPQIALPRLADGEPQRGRVLHIVKESLPFFERGYTIRSHSTFLSQLQAGFEPVAVTSLGFPRHYGFGNFPIHERIDGIEHHRLDLGPEYDLPRVPLDLQLDDHATMLARLADDLRPEIIQAGSGYRGYETALVGLAVSKRLGVPFIYEFRSHLEHTWTGEIERSEAGEQYDGRRRQELRCLTEADAVVTIAEAMRAELIELGVPGTKVRVVPNVVDVKRFAPREPDPALQRRYGLRGRKVVGYISNLGKREGIDNLVHAVARLRSGGEDVAGLVVGTGPEAEVLADLIKELGLEKHFVLTGHVPNEQIEDHYALIDVFVVPRIDDKAARLVTPLKPLEAMAMRRPVVASDLPALREMVTAGERGELFPAGDADALASLLGELLSDDERRHELGVAGRQWVERDRTVQANAERYRSVLDAIRGA